MAFKCNPSPSATFASVDLGLPIVQACRKWQRLQAAADVTVCARKPRNPKPAGFWRPLSAVCATAPSGGEPDGGDEDEEPLRPRLSPPARFQALAVAVAEVGGGGELRNEGRPLGILNQQVFDFSLTHHPWTPGHPLDTRTPDYR